MDGFVIHAAHDVRVSVGPGMMAVGMPLAVVIAVTISLAVMMAVGVSLSMAMARGMALTRMPAVIAMVAMGVTACVMPIAVVTAVVLAVTRVVTQIPVVAVMTRCPGNRTALVAGALVRTFVTTLALALAAVIATMIVGTGETGTQGQG